MLLRVSLRVAANSSSVAAVAARLAVWVILVNCSLSCGSSSKKVFMTSANWLNSAVHGWSFSPPPLRLRQFSFFSLGGSPLPLEEGFSKSCRAPGSERELRPGHSQRKPPNRKVWAVPKTLRQPL
uniref:Putative secreted protein n=1 Tax=Ixodes ricinus TaxID=34613 RepID=A0A6B0UQN8_IXORI